MEFKKAEEIKRVLQFGVKKKMAEEIESERYTVFFASPWNSAMIEQADGMRVIRKVISQYILCLLACCVLFLFLA